MGIIVNTIYLKEFRKQLRKDSTKAEVILWEQLRSRRFHELKFRRQHSFYGFILDFYCPSLKLCIEIDGEYHENPDQIEYDQDRETSLRSLSITVVRYTNKQILNDLDSVLYDLTENILPLLQGRGKGRVNT